MKPKVYLFALGLCLIIAAALFLRANAKHAEPSTTDQISPINADPESPSTVTSSNRGESDPGNPVPETGFCDFQNAQDFWYRNGESFHPRLMTRGAYYEVDAQKLLLIRQEKTENAETKKTVVTLNASWIDRQSFMATVATEINTLDDFVDNKRAFELTDPHWTESIPVGRAALMDEETFDLGSQQSISFHNKIAVAVEASVSDPQSGQAFRVSCPEKAECRCTASR